MKKIDWNVVLHDTYVELYKNSEPSVDFDELIDDAKANNRKDPQGRLIIDFMAYEIDGVLMDEIVNSFIKKYKMKEHNQNGYKFAIYLGCSPKTKRYD